jgi:hypothetical protein
MVPLLKYRQFGLRHLTDIGRSLFGADPLLAFGVGPHRLIRNMKAPSMTSIFPATAPTFSMTLFTSSSRGLCGDRKTVVAMACCKEFMQWRLAHCLSLAPRPLAGDTLPGMPGGDVRALLLATVTGQYWLVLQKYI